MDFYQVIKKIFPIDRYNLNPKHIIKAKEYASQFNTNYYKVFSSEEITWPNVDGGNPFIKNLANNFPEIGILEIKNGNILGPHGWCIGEKGYFISENSWYGADIENIEILNNKIKKKYVKGNILNISSDWAYNNYGHFMLDSLPRYYIYQQIKMLLPKIDYYYCSCPNIKKYSWIFKKLNIPLEKCIFAKPKESVTADRIFSTSFPGLKRNYPKWTAKFLKTLIKPRPLQRIKPLRIYVTRENGARKPKNEVSIQKIFTDHGFIIYDPAKNRIPPYDFVNADIVVGSHGAGLTDIVFCKSKTKVIEFVPSDHIYPYYYSIAAAAELDYSCIICNSEKQRQDSSFGPSPYDFTVDEKDLENKLYELENNPKIFRSTL